MNSSNASLLTDVGPNTRSEKSLQLSGRWLVLARTACVGLFIFSLTVFCADLPDYFAQLHLVCSGSPCPLWQLTPTHVQELQQLGLSIESYAVLSIVLGIISVFVWSAIGAFIAWHKSNDRIALLVAMLLFTSGIGTQSATDLKTLTTPVVTNSSPWFAPTILIFCLMLFLLLHVFLHFPDGRFVPNWTRWLPFIGLALTGASATLAILHISFSPWFYIFTFAVCLGLSMVAQTYRYYYISSPIQRQQSKCAKLSVFGNHLRECSGNSI